MGHIADLRLRNSRRRWLWFLTPMMVIWAIIAVAVAGMIGFGFPARLVTGNIFFDRDCKDFRTQREAQAYFLSEGVGDPHRLDADHDGRACETLHWRR